MPRNRTRLPEPQNCDRCGAPGPKFVMGTIPKDRPSAWPYMWVCDSCGASVGTHSESRAPLGFMAGREVRRLRRLVHLKFDPIWENSHWQRDELYNWLADWLGIAPDDCHVSLLSMGQLRQALDFCREKENELRVKKRREKKQRKKQRKQCQRAFKRGKNHGKFGRTYRRPQHGAASEADKE